MGHAGLLSSTVGRQRASGFAAPALGLKPALFRVFARAFSGFRPRDFGDGGSLPAAGFGVEGL